MVVDAEQVHQRGEARAWARRAGRCSAPTASARATSMVSSPRSTVLRAGAPRAPRRAPIAGRPGRPSCCASRWCWCAGSCSAAGSGRRSAPRRWAGSRARRCRRARCGRSRAPPSTSSGSSRRRSRTSPWRPPSAARPSGRTPCAAPGPSCCRACRPRSSGPTGAGSGGTRCRSGPGRSARRPRASSPPRSRRARRSSARASRCAPS